MKKVFKITIRNILICSILFFACQPKKISDQNVTDSGSTINQNQSKDTHLANTDSIETTRTIDSDCVRGQAEPILKKSIYPNSAFKLNSDGISGIETVNLENGDKLIIENSGCEYYVLVFRFETSRFQADTTDILFWLDKGIKLMTEVEKGINSNLVIDGIDEIEKFLDDPKGLMLGEEIIIHDGEIRSFGLVRRIQKINAKKYGVEIVFATGPL